MRNLKFLLWCKIFLRIIIYRVTRHSALGALLDDLVIYPYSRTGLGRPKEQVFRHIPKCAERWGTNLCNIPRTSNTLSLSSKLTADVALSANIIPSSAQNAVDGKHPNTRLRHLYLTEYFTERPDFYILVMDSEKVL